MGSRKRRSWSDEEKRSICHQTTAPGVSVAQVARRYALNGNQIFNWLKDERFAPGVDVAEIEDGVFLPVAVSDEPETAFTAVHQATPVRDQDGRSIQRIEISLADGHRITAEGGFDLDALTRLLKGLVS
jgi:transposase